MHERQRPRALVVDDELSICQSCQRILLRLGFDARTALSGREALAMLEREAFDLVFTDLKMLGVGGLELLENLQTRFPEVVCVVITGYATVASVVETMRLGAYDYLPKPFTAQEFAAAARKAWERRKQILDRKAQQNGQNICELLGIVGQSPAMIEVSRLIQKVAATDSTVLIIGESGTGKELIARAVHQLSPRKLERFFAIDCSSLPPNMLQSELFGHVKGAFTGAGNKTGVFEVADRGTVFLDEICNLDLEIQARLLRFIQECELLPVGCNQPRKVDVRLIFATNRDLGEMVAEGSFREDLYYQLCVVPIYLPPLRERKEDIAPLAAHLLAKVQAKIGKQIATISDGALRLLQEYDWPGNIGQLENVMEWATITCDKQVIEASHLPRDLFRQNVVRQMAVPHTNTELLAMKRKLRDQAIADLERVFVLQALERNEWNVSRAAREVGVKRQNFQAMMRKHHISSERQ